MILATVADFVHHNKADMPPEASKVFFKTKLASATAGIKSAYSCYFFMNICCKALWVNRICCGRLIFR